MPRFRPGHGNIHHSSPLDMESTPEMSILNKLKNASGQMSNCLLEKHPLAGESLELRLQYLAAIALATAIDREATLAERQAFNGLAASLAIEAGDAEEQFNERANVEEDSIAVLFEALRARQAGQLYMLDLAWIHAVDGEVDENEHVVTEHLAHLLGMPVQAVQELHEFAVALHRKELSRVYRLFPTILGDELLKELLTPLIQKQMPFAGVLKGRWIDHGNLEITDCTTGVTWLNKRIEGVISAACTPITGEMVKHVIEKINELNSSYSDKSWCLPLINDCKSICDLENGYDSDVFSDLRSR